MDEEFGVSLDDGWIEADLAAELPGLWLATVAVACRPGPSARGVRERLRIASGRINGAKAVAMRREPVPSAYRVFFRMVGLDPDHTRTPVEEAAFQRLMSGGYAPTERIADAALLALVETGVPVVALDDDRLEGPLGIRAARAGERLGDGPHANDLLPGRLVLADSRAPAGELFGLLAHDRQVRTGTRHVRLGAIGVQGVPRIHVEEALWTALEALATP